MGSATAKSSRLDMRMTAEQRELIELAASIKGKNITQWSLDNLLAAAQRDIEDESITTLTASSYKYFVAALDKGMPDEAKELLGTQPVWE